jgi:hypothetical protein
MPTPSTWKPKPRRMLPASQHGMPRMPSMMLRSRRQKQAALDQQRANEEGQVAQHQAQADMDHRAQVFKDANRLGLGSAAANTGALFQAAAIAGQGALGHDSPLYVEAEKKAEDALRDLENQVSQAQKQVDDAKKTKADEAGGVLAGFTVQRSLTQASGDRIVGELTTQTVYLKDIRDAVAPQGGGAAAGILAALPPIHVTTTLNVDGEKMATNVSRHQSRKLQQHQMRNQRHCEHERMSNPFAQRLWVNERPWPTSRCSPLTPRASTIRPPSQPRMVPVVGRVGSTPGLQ